MDIIGFHGFAQVGKDTAALHLTSGRGFTRFAFADEIRDHLYEIDPFVDGTTSVARLVQEKGSLDAAAADRIHGAEVTRLRQVMDRLSRETFNAPLQDGQLLALDPLLGGTLTLADVVDGCDGDWDLVKKDRRAGAESRKLMQLYGTESIRHFVSQQAWVKVLEQNIAKTGSPFPIVVTDVRENQEAEWIKEMGGIVIEITRPGVTRVNAHSSENGIDRRHIHAVISNDSNRTELALKLDDALGLAAPVAEAA